MATIQTKTKGYRPKHRYGGKHRPAPPTEAEEENAPNEIEDLAGIGGMTPSVCEKDEDEKDDDSAAESGDEKE